MKELTEQLKNILAELRQRFEELYGDRLAEMILFGSRARHDAEPGSDIDVLVVLKGRVDATEEIERTLDVVADMSLTNNTVVSCVFMDEERFTRRAGPLLRNVRREGIPI